MDGFYQERRIIVCDKKNSCIKPKDISVKCCKKADFGKQRLAGTGIQNKDRKNKCCGGDRDYKISYQIISECNSPCRRKESENVEEQCIEKVTDDSRCHCKHKILKKKRYRPKPTSRRKTDSNFIVILEAIETGLKCVVVTLLVILFLPFLLIIACCKIITSPMKTKCCCNTKIMKNEMSCWGNQIKCLCHKVKEDKCSNEKYKRYTHLRGHKKGWIVTKQRKRESKPDEIEVRVAYDGKILCEQCKDDTVKEIGKIRKDKETNKSGYENIHGSFSSCCCMSKKPCRRRKSGDFQKKRCCCRCRSLGRRRSSRTCDCTHKKCKKPYCKCRRPKKRKSATKNCEEILKPRDTGESSYCSEIMSCLLNSLRVFIMAIGFCLICPFMLCFYVVFEMCCGCLSC